MRKIIVNGMILTASSLLLRLIGVAFSSFVGSTLGAEGMGLYTLVMSVYGFALTLASSGVSLAATRLCSEVATASERKAAMRRCVGYAMLTGSISACVIFFGAEFIAVTLLGDARCIGSLKLLALSMPPIAMSNALAGYFTAVRRVYKSAASGIFEQAVKVTVSVVGVLKFADRGLEAACMALVGGGMIAECASFLLALVLYLLDRGRRDRRQNRCRQSRIAENRTHGSLGAKLLGITLPVAAAAIVRSGFSTLEHILIPRGLRKNPATADGALAAYGLLCGMALPIVMLPTALLYSFSGLLIPEFAESASRGDSDRIERMASRTLTLTLAFSLGCSALIFALAPELGILLYKSAECGRFIRLLSPLIPVMYLDHVIDAMLKGLGEQLYCMKVNILDAAMSATLVWILCGKIGIYGYVVTIFIAELVNASLSLARLLKRVRPRVSLGRTVYFLVSAAISALACAFMPGESAMSTILRILVGLGTYLTLLVLTRRSDSQRANLSASRTPQPILHRQSSSSLPHL